MKHVVTGGCGFIGSHLVDHLVNLGHEVVVIDDLSTSEDRIINPGATLVKGSVTDLQLVTSVIKEADCVFHTAAWARVPRSVDDPVGTHKVNVNGTLNVLQAARENGVGRVVYSSSSSVYGGQKTHLMREDMAPNPMSPYALHKLIGEQYASLFARLFGMRIVSLRYFNVYGPDQTAGGAYALVIPHFLKMRAEGRPLTVYGDGNQTRSYTHVSDVVRANVLASYVDLPGGENTVLNIGSAEETSVNEIAAMVGGEVEHIIPNPRGKFEELRKAADSTKARATIGWEPRIAPSEGIRTVVTEGEDSQDARQGA